MQLSVLLVIGFIFALTNARTISWTNAGGNPLWNNAGNWDCQCLPTIADDVVIDIAAIPGNVEIGGTVAPALAHSLTVGGNSRFPQTLTVAGPLTIGTGTSKLATNGKIVIESGPESPFSNDGQFNVEGSGFTFFSGTLAGRGSIVFSPTATLNLTGAATKTISTSINATAVVVSTDSGTNLAIAKGGSFTLTGTFAATKSLSVSVDSTSSFVVRGSGSLVFTGSVLNFEGTSFTLSSWSIGSGTATIDNSITSGSLNIAGGSLILIGGPTDRRTFDKITGTGHIYNQGGVNLFKSVHSTGFNATGGNVTVVSGTIVNFNLRGAFVVGGKISATTSLLESGFLTGGAELATYSLTLSGVISLIDNGTSVLVTKTGVVSKSSLLTLTGGSSLQINFGATLQQLAPLQIVQGAPTTSSPFVTVNGGFQSSSSFTVSQVPISGETGSYVLSSKAIWSFNNVKFSAQSISSAGSIALSTGTFHVTTITGTGLFSGDPIMFLSNSLTASTFTLHEGRVLVTNFGLTTLNLYNGIFGVTGSGKITTFNFLGGRFLGENSSDSLVPVSATLTIITGSATQTLNAIGLTTATLSLQCGLSASCQLFTSNCFIRSF